MSSMTRTRRSSFLRYRALLAGSNKKSARQELEQLHLEISDRRRSVEIAHRASYVLHVRARPPTLHRVSPRHQYCCVGMSSVKWCSTDVVFLRSAILTVSTSTLSSAAPSTRRPSVIPTYKFIAEVDPRVSSDCRSVREHEDLPICSSKGSRSALAALIGLPTCNVPSAPSAGAVCDSSNGSPLQKSS